MKKLLEAINNGIAKALTENNIEFNSVENINDLEDLDNLTSKNINTNIEARKEGKRQEIIRLFSKWVSGEMYNWRSGLDCDEKSYRQFINNLEQAEDYFNNKFESFLEDYGISNIAAKLFVDWDDDLLPIIQSEVTELETWAEEWFEDRLYKYCEPWEWGEYDDDEDEWLVDED